MLAIENCQEIRIHSERLWTSREHKQYTIWWNVKKNIKWETLLYNKNFVIALLLDTGTSIKITT